jgi:hypothetical protein
MSCPELKAHDRCRPRGRARTGSLAGGVNARQNSQIVFLRFLSGLANVAPQAALTP